MQPAMKDKTARTLDVEDVTVRYGAAVAVDGVSLSIEPGEVVALLGPSGCGKTTLLRVVAGFVRQITGRVLIDGAPSTTCRPTGATSASSSRTTPCSRT